MRIGLILMFSALGGIAAPATTRADQARLVVVIVVDQLRADYLTRFRPYFCENGFNRLLRRGAFFENAFVPYLATETGPGHATISTGAFPREHGVVANTWFFGPGDAKPRAAVEDATVNLIGIESEKKGGQSPRNLCGTTIGDQLKMSDHRSRVFSVALKDRAAIFLAGKDPDGVYWGDKRSGLFVTSSYYASSLPSFISEFNKQGGMKQFAGKKWDRLLPIEAYVGTQACDAKWSKVLTIVGGTFPHTLPSSDDNNSRYFADLVAGTPFSNDVVLAFAKDLVTTENLGKGPVTDMLFVGLSANDHAGHVFGPDSPEVMDMTVRTDRQLAEFFDTLDKNVGLDHCLIALTADHGTTSSVFAIDQKKLGGGSIKEDELAARMNDTLSKIDGVGGSNRKLVRGIGVPWVWLDTEFAELDRKSSGKLGRSLKDALLNTPGIARVFTPGELDNGAPPPTDFDLLLAWRSYFPGRAGQFAIKLAPLWQPYDEVAIGKHASGSRNDRHVPIVFCGPGIRAGRYLQDASLTDIAVTIAALLGIEAPENATGRVLSEMIEN